MFSNLIFRNSRRSRKENGLFFSSLIISIVTFYMILAISTQDVMIFLQEMESDAVKKLMLLIPVFFGMTLVILFFLTYFSCKYQFERRRHELGVYLMLGMRRSKLFRMLLAEDLLSSVVALFIGLPTAVVLSEIISLVTAKLVGMGIIGHQFSLSWSAIMWTLAGVLGIILLAILILSGRISRQEIGTLLSQSMNRPKQQMSNGIYCLAAFLGIVMLAVAYFMAIQGLVKAGKGNKKLHVFTYRQIQENVIYKSSSMVISSLLILAALCCFGVGIGIVTTNKLSASHVLDYTFESHQVEIRENY